MRNLLFFSWLFFCLPLFVFGQLSKGGVPIGISDESTVPVISMEPIDNLMVKAAVLNENYVKVHKPLTFAYGFEVNISPARDGVWSYDVEGYDIWRVKVRSDGAYSLSLLFDEFHLPAGSRLFIYNEEEGDVAGAFTSTNNKSFGKLAVLPVKGEEVTVQYEVPSNHNSLNDFVIREVAHDFIGIWKNDRRPMNKTSGACNVDANCEIGAEWSDLKDAAVRIIISKSDLPGKPREFCSGVLVNNTSEDGKPYILTAAHCFDKPEYAETSIFTFNYESPYCAPLDGDASNSISGALLRAFSDSLDFALTELTTTPPPEFRPYFAGWDRRAVPSDSSMSIHHPMGDIKKIAITRSPVVTTDFKRGYVPNGFFNVSQWHEGVTEAGSSGGALFNADKRLIGTLTGGAASCHYPYDDYFSRFDLAWTFLADSSGQLKCWLDPDGIDPIVWNGSRVFSKKDLCVAVTNLKDFDNHKSVTIRDRGRFKGYWGGSNSLGIVEFAEQFILPGEAEIYGISIGTGKKKLTRGDIDYKLRLKVYKGGELPEELLYSEDFDAEKMAVGVMNFIDFSERVTVQDTVFIGVELMNFTSSDTLVILQSERPKGETGNYCCLQDGQWIDPDNSSNSSHPLTSVMELFACGISDSGSNYKPLILSSDLKVYPNPTSGLMMVEAASVLEPSMASVYDLMGRELDLPVVKIGESLLQIDLSGYVSGNYFLKLNTSKEHFFHKIQLIHQY